MALNEERVVAFAGGVGGAKLALGLMLTLPADRLTVVVNVGDDFERYGLRICTDLDTVMYKWDTGNWANFPSPYDLTLPSGDGDHILQINATDKAGNWIVRTYVFTTYDPEPPTSTSETSETEKTTSMTSSTTTTTEAESGTFPGVLIVLAFFSTIVVYSRRRNRL